MATQTVAAVFASEPAAREAKAALIGRGIGAERITISASVTDDALAGEAPGQSYENQQRVEPLSDRRAAQYGEAVRAGACVLSVNVRSANEGQQVAELMRGQGARRVMRQP